MTLDYFYTNVVNEYVDPKDSTYKQDGRQVSQGVEFVSQGKIFRDLTIVGGCTWLNAEYKTVQSAPVMEGNPLINVPEKQARAFLEYSFPWIPLHLSVGANYYGVRSLTVPETEHLPGAETFDAGLRFDPTIKNHKITLNVNVNNLDDKHYWANYRDGEGLELGQGRTISAALKIQIL
jgi:iron complex outermembrane receptor protein